MRSTRKCSIDSRLWSLREDSLGGYGAPGLYDALHRLYCDRSADTDRYMIPPREQETISQTSPVGSSYGDVKYTVIRAPKLDTLCRVFQARPLRARGHCDMTVPWYRARDSLQLQDELVEVDGSTRESNVILTVVASGI